jgi:hypothetical protein
VIEGEEIAALKSIRLVLEALFPLVHATEQCDVTQVRDSKAEVLCELGEVIASLERRRARDSAAEIEK